ncbi:MAG TPA: lipid II flippase MurJ [Candidatus Acidoferrum sp.]|nr:lipid II flippase MurJ [Candidatus Acidoferrum sp.]
MSAESHRASFFRQSGWLMFATVTGGLFMTAVHLLSKALPVGAYGEFGVFLIVAMFLPVMPLQMVLAQQTAQALALGREHLLSGIIRGAWIGTFVVWLVGAVAVLLFQPSIMAHMKITNPAAVWVALPVLLFTIWMPMFYGILQGQQNFLWMGWSMMANGVGRVGFAALAVLAFHFYASGMVTGMLGGLTAALILAIWPTRSLWLPSPVPVNWRGLLRQIIPLTVGFGVYQFLLTADTLVVKWSFSSATSDFYLSAGTLARASTWLVGPLATVMFPKLVHAKARSEKSDLLGVVLLGTLIFSAAGATGLCVLGRLAVKIIFTKDYLEAATALLPWYAWAVVPLALANVLINNLLAHSHFKVLPALCVLAVGYGFALGHFHGSPVMVIKVLGLGNLALFAVCAWYTWGGGRITAAD